MQVLFGDNVTGSSPINYYLFLADNGNIGIGKKDPAVTLDINGALKTTSAEITGLLKTQSANISGALSAQSANISGALAAQNANINGLLKTKEVQVTLTGWPDYVFEKDYELLPLTEVEQFIATHKHLPNVPSAATVEENGINIGEMNAILLQKVEELTLYILQQNRQLIELQNQINELKNSKP